MTPDDLLREYETSTQIHGIEHTLALIDENAVYWFSDGTCHIGKTAIEEAIRAGVVSSVMGVVLLGCGAVLADHCCGQKHGKSADSERILRSEIVVNAPRTSLRPMQSSGGQS